MAAHFVERLRALTEATREAYYESTAVHAIKLPACLGMPTLRGAHRSRGQSTRSCALVNGTDIPRSPADRARHPYPAERAYVPKYRLAADSNHGRYVLVVEPRLGAQPPPAHHRGRCLRQAGLTKARLDMQAEGLHALQGQRGGGRLSSESHRAVVEPQPAS